MSVPDSSATEGAVCNGQQETQVDDSVALQHDKISCNNETDETEQKICEENAQTNLAATLSEQAKAMTESTTSSVLNSDEVEGKNGTNEATRMEAAKVFQHAETDDGATREKTPVKVDSKVNTEAGTTTNEARALADTAEHATLDDQGDKASSPAFSRPATGEISRTNSEPLRGAVSAVNASNETPGIGHTVASTTLIETDVATATPQDVKTATNTTNTEATAIMATTSSTMADADAVTKDNNADIVEHHPRIVRSRALLSGLLSASFISAYTVHFYATGIFLGVAALALAMTTFKVDVRDTKTLMRGSAVAIPLAGVLTMYPGVVTVVVHDLWACLLHWISGE